MQDLTYDEGEAESEATAARKSAKPAVMKKIVTARSIGFTTINSRTSDVKESEEDSEEEAPEEPTTRHSKRLMKKDANDSGPSQSNKKQKMTIGKSVKPTKEAPVPAQSSTSDSWAAQTPSATKESHHGKLLPLLTSKAQDVHKLEAELATAQKLVKALQERNERLEKEATEARMAVLDTRPLMVRLMGTTRKAQGTLTSLVAAISEYGLTATEKEYLRSLAKDNDLMTDDRDIGSISQYHGFYIF